jgi:hypothetical protein
MPAEELRRAREICEQAHRNWQGRPTQEQQEKQSTQDQQLLGMMAKGDVLLIVGST